MNTEANERLLVLPGLVLGHALGALMIALLAATDSGALRAIRSASSMAASTALPFSVSRLTQAVVVAPAGR